MKGTRRLVVLGIVGRAPLAGVGWQALHYLEGFRRLGFDVSYVEETADGPWPYDPEQNAVTGDCRYAVQYIARLMAWCGLGDRWAYCAETGRRQVFGLSETELDRLVMGADALVNLTGTTVLRDRHLRVPVRIYLETDPVLAQILVARGDAYMTELLASHTHHFTFGENLGAADCGVPTGRFRYHATRQPVVLDWWPPAPMSPIGNGPSARMSCFTTVATWQQSGKDVEWSGQAYHWSKHVEFMKFLELPRHTAQPFELALAAGNASPSAFAEATRALRAHGWRVADALAISRDIATYRDYIRSSRGEFTVAKEQNVRLRSGWFSDRSACYLAAGRPVITQDTGFGAVLPTGRGLFAFESMDQVLAALAAVSADYPAHAAAAREIAAEYFSAERVLARLAATAGL